MIFAKGWPELILYPVTALCWGALALCPERVSHHLPTLQLLHTMARELPQGHVNGTNRGRQNPADFAQLETGDILLLHNPNGAYGYWTHAALYVGGRRVVDANDFRLGTVVNSVDLYRQYDEVAVFRVQAPQSARLQAAQLARRALGKPYDLFASAADTHSEYCSKLVWQCYAAAGVQLCSPHLWVLPDDLAKSPRVHQAYRWTSESGRRGRSVSDPVQ